MFYWELYEFFKTEAVKSSQLCRKCVLKNFAILTGVSLQVFRPQTPTQVFPMNIAKTFKNDYFDEHLGTTAPKAVYLKNTSEQLLLYHQI